MLCHHAGAPSQHHPGQQASDQGVAQADPGGGQPVFPTELSGVADEHHCGKVGRPVGEGREPGPNAPAAQHEIVHVGGVPAGAEADNDHDGKENDEQHNFNKHGMFLLCFARPPGRTSVGLF